MDIQRFNTVHVAAGSANGGQFGSGGGGAKPAAGHTGHAAKHPPAHTGPPRHTLAYNPKTNTGAGYGMPNGDPNVERLQAKCNALGLTDSHGKPLRLDGKLGPLTTSSIKALQTHLGVKADGQVSPAFFAQVLALKKLPPAHHAAPGHRPATHAKMEGRGELVSGFASLSFVRSFPLSDVSIRAGGDGRTVDAYATVFDTPTPIHDQDGDYIEVIDPHAFDRILPKLAPSGSRANWKVGVFYNHGMTLHGTPSDRNSMPIGVPLEIRADGHGLFTRTRYSKGADIDRILDAISEGSLSAYSFSGRFDRSNPMPPRGGFRAGRAGDLPTVRRTESTLREYGPTPFPAYQDAAIVGVRAEQISDQLDRITELLRSGGTLPAFDPGDLPQPSGAPEHRDSPPEDSHTVRSGRSVKEELAARRSAFLQKYGSQ